MTRFICNGVRRFEYTSKRTGNPVKAAHVYCELSTPQPGTVGKQYEVLFITQDVLDKLDVSDDLLVGSGIDAYYNRYGSVDSLVLG